jgi:hypothetical protein
VKLAVGSGQKGILTPIFVVCCFAFVIRWQAVGKCSVGLCVLLKGRSAIMLWQGDEGDV